MEGALRRSLGSQAQHTHSLEDHTWSIQQSTTTHTKHIHNIQQQNSNYTHTHCELFHQTIHEHCQAQTYNIHNIQHLHDETLTLPIHEHPQLHASQYKQKTQHPSHPLHKHTTYFNTPMLKKTRFLTTAATQQTFPQTPTQSLQQT